MKPLPKLALLVVAVAVVVYGLKTGVNRGWIPGAGILKAVIPQKVTLPDVKDAKVADVAPAPFPSTNAAGCSDPIRSEIWAWNSQMGWIYSNGGAETTKGSLADKHGVCLRFNRQDDTSQMRADLLACASELKDSTECSSGVHFVTIMGDGAAQFLAPLNAQAKKICPSCTAEIIGTSGFSRGEDGFWGPDAWKRSPKSSLGDGLIAGVLRDGDWNIAQKWASDNGLKNNPDEHTFDPQALNWVNTPTYTDAAEKYVAGYCEDRKLMKDGHLTGDTKNFCVKGYVTWTPGDVTAAKKKGGAVRVVSTKEYRSQMPSVIIGIKKWNLAHSDRVAGMLAAALEGGDQVKAFPTALRKAAEISAKVYNEQDADYWSKYYIGSVERDSQGRTVELGGSYASNMNDALTVFGLAPGSNNNVKATYTVFLKIVDQQYHDLFKDTPLPPYEQVSNTSYLLQAKSLLDNAGSEAEVTHYSSDHEPTEVVSTKNWDIEFATGSAQLTPRGQSLVREIKDQIAITQLTVLLNGHTDNTGDRNHNLTLSQQRAQSVMSALQQLAPSDFPSERFKVRGYGPDKPIDSNSTADGKARNRRVEIVLAE